MSGTKSCRDCGKSIIFLRTSYGKWMPLDQTPDPVRGNVIAMGGAAVAFKNAALAEAKLREMGREGKPRFTSHHDTCTEKAKRKRREVEKDGGQLPLL